MIRIAEYPQLKMIAWNRKDDARIDEQEAFALYERNWFYVDTKALDHKEKALLQRLTRVHGHGVMNV